VAGWTKKMTNEEVLVRTVEPKSVLKKIWHMKHRWFWHVLWHDNLLPDIIEEKLLDMATWVGKG